MDKIQRQEISNCYSDETYIELDKNLEMFTIFLVSKNNTKCNVFPTDVYVNLTLSNPFDHMLQIQLQNFSYQNTSLIVIHLDYEQIIPGSTFEDFAYSKFVYISIYTLSEITKFQVMSSYIKKSNLQDCFVLMTLTINANNISLITYPLNECKLQISNTNSESKMIGMSIIINDNEFEFNSSQLSSFINCYQSPSCYEIESILQTDMSEIRLQPFHTAKFKIISHQGTIDVAIEYPIKYIYVSSTNIIQVSSIYTYLQKGQARIYIQNDSLIPMIELDQMADMQSIQQQLDLIVYTKVVQRLSCKLNSKQFTYQQVVYGYFNLSEQSFIVSCNEGTQNQREYCQTFYDYAYDKQDTECKLDVLFYNGEICNYIQKIELANTFTCIQRFRLTEDKYQNACVFVQYKQNSSFCQNLFETEYLYDIMYLTKYEHQLYYEKVKLSGMATYIPRDISNSTIQFCFNCSDMEDQYITGLNEVLKCNSVKQYFKKKNYWKLSIFNDQSLSSSYIETDYRTVKYTNMAVGTLIFVISLAFCILQIKQTRAMIQEVKHKKVHKRKP
ncbi:Conserved_hypothetical protein [Hexamita inflata]|uniref:Transmembrane protein n=1 Tax=Hexamita inflata TaxID=28002 RepID=A0AA86TTJ5_9EUKA|nr:Conserved hypothetical protein [Hexamita inflata]